MITRQKSLSSALKEQRELIEKLKKEEPIVFKGFGKEVIFSFHFAGFRYEDGSNDTQKKIDLGTYKSIEDFDSYHTSDIEFEDLYTGKDIDKYRVF